MMDYIEMHNIVMDVFADHPELDVQDTEDLAQVLSDFLAHVARTNPSLTVSEALKLLNESRA